MCSMADREVLLAEEIPLMSTTERETQSVKDVPVEVPLPNKNTEDTGSREEAPQAEVSETGNRPEVLSGQADDHTATPKKETRLLTSGKTTNISECSSQNEHIDTPSTSCEEEKPQRVIEVAHDVRQLHSLNEKITGAQTARSEGDETARAKEIPHDTQKLATLNERTDTTAKCSKINDTESKRDTPREVCELDVLNENTDTPTPFSEKDVTVCEAQATHGVRQLETLNEDTDTPTKCSNENETPCAKEASHDVPKRHSWTENADKPATFSKGNEKDGEIDATVNGSTDIPATFSRGNEKACAADAIPNVRKLRLLTDNTDTPFRKGTGIACAKKVIQKLPPLNESTSTPATFSQENETACAIKPIQDVHSLHPLSAKTDTPAKLCEEGTASSKDAIHDVRKLPPLKGDTNISKPESVATRALKDRSPRITRAAINGNHLNHATSKHTDMLRNEEDKWQHYLTHPAHGYSLRDQAKRLSNQVKPRSREHVRFTVTPVRQTSLNAGTGSGRKHLAVFEVGEDGDVTDTLTQNSITSLLSAKFRDLSKRWKQYGEESPRFRKRLVSKWESMNYDQIDSQLHQEENDKLKNRSKKKLAWMWVSRWLMMFLVGIGTSLLAAGVHIAVELVAHQKFHLIAKYLDKCEGEGCLIKPVAIWCGINLGISVLAAALVTFVQPTAAGSGIPLIKSYLNGVRVPGLLSLRCFIAKIVGVVLSILGGLSCGKEGPMAHSGGIVAAGLGKGRIPWFNRDIKLYNVFRTDHEVRDFVAAGAASGVSAAFGAPVGGTLFSVEEAASFWNTELVWRVFFSAMIACFSTNFLLSAFEGHPTELSHPGLVRFSTFPNLSFDLIEIPVFVLMAVIGGLTGSLFVVMNYKLTIFRQKYLHRHNWIKVAEAGLVSVASAVIGFMLMFGVRECTTAKPNNSHAITSSMFCDAGSINSMSTLFLTTPEGCLKSLLHDPLDSYGAVSLIAFIVIFFLLAVWTYGLSVSSGVFIPSLAIGAAWGRLIGMGVVHLFPDQAKDVGKYALIGAASQLGGILRTTISLTVIIVECTGDISFGLCIMITLMISKWVGDFFTTGLYDMNVEVSGIPLLSWEPPPLSDNVRVSEFMSTPTLLLTPREKVGHILDILENETFHGFPILEQDPSSSLQFKGKLKGLILRDQLLTLLQKKAFAPEGRTISVKVTAEEFNDPYPVTQRVSIKDLEISEDEKHYVMDFRPYMNRTPYTVNPDFSLPRVFRLFRGLGLRHLVVVDEDYQPIGMVTRKDLAKYRAGTKRGMLHMEQLTIESV